ncbi:MAG: LysM peptidoglycan-binding domain-containing protein [Actinomycetota bacterium]|nr:LysM peptidoglycan-binding domain-containing protein [Actinomycetota bacterium]
MPSGRPTAVRRPVRVVVRQRRVVATLGTTTLLLALVAAAAHAVIAWGLAGLGVVLTVAYMAVVARMRALAVEREMSIAFGPGSSIGDAEWAGLERDLRLHSDPDAEPVLEAPARRGAVATFVLASLLAWLLTPVVAMISLARGDLSGLRTRGVLDRLVRAQQYGRAQSLKVLTVSVAVTAGVTGVSAVAGASMAGATPVAQATPASSSAAVGASTYTVRAGDTLGAIAQSYGLSVASLASANGITKPDLITAGQHLAVNLPPYTVRSGDTLGVIAQRYGRSMTTLASANGIADINLITIGQVLQVGGGTLPAASQPTPAASKPVTTKVAPAPTAAPVAATTPAAPALIGSGTYTVRAGDALGAIAAKFNTWTASLVAANHLASANAIAVGQVLQVGGQGANAPKPAPAPAATPVARVAATPAPARAVAPAPARAAVSAPAASGAAAAVQTALAQVGTPYVYGGASPGGFDCSGLIMYAWAHAGVQLPHYSGAQYGAMAHISMRDLQPGDVVFFADPGEHEAMYIGGGKIVEAPHTGADVRVVPLYSQYVLAGRP